MSRTLETQRVERQVEVLRCDGCGRAVVSNDGDTTIVGAPHAKRPTSWYAAARNDGTDYVVECCSLECLVIAATAARNREKEAIS